MTERKPIPIEKSLDYKEKPTGIVDNLNNERVATLEEKPLIEKIFKWGTFKNSAIPTYDVAQAVELFRKDMEERLIFVDYYLKLRFGDLKK